MPAKKILIAIRRVNLEFFRNCFFLFIVKVHIGYHKQHAVFFIYVRPKNRKYVFSDFIQFFKIIDSQNIFEAFISSISSLCSITITPVGPVFPGNDFSISRNNAFSSLFKGMFIKFFFPVWIYFPSVIPRPCPCFLCRFPAG